MASQPQFCGDRRRLADVIRLHRSVGDDRVGPLGKRIGHQEFELPYFIAASRQTGAIVPLDPELRATESGAQVLQRLQWSRQMPKMQSGETGQRHASSRPSIDIEAETQPE